MLIISIGSHAASFLNVQEEKTIFLCLLDLIISQGHSTIHCVRLLVLYSIDCGSKGDISILLAGLESSWEQVKKSPLTCPIRGEWRGVFILRPTFKQLRPNSVSDRPRATVTADFKEWTSLERSVKFIAK